MTTPIRVQRKRTKGWKMPENTKERPILFSTPMVTAILDGRKTMTRRIIKPQPEVYEFDGKTMYRWSTKNHIIQSEVNDQMADPFLGIPCRYGQIGDVLWVRETWAKLNLNDESGYAPLEYYYIADGKDYELTDGDGYRLYRKDGSPKSVWRPSIHMPKAACRIKLKITDIRVERLQEITEADAIAEGVESKNGLYKDYNSSLYNPNNFTKQHIFQDPIHFKHALDSFNSLWSEIHGIGVYCINPWVWVIQFEKI